MGHADYIAPHLDSVTFSDNDYAEFPDIITPQLTTANQPKTRSEAPHPHHRTVAPLHARARRLPPDKLQLAKDEFRQMEEMGIVRPPL